MLTCKEVAEDLASGRCEKRGLLHRIQVRIHAWLCPGCRAYAEQMDTITRAAKSLGEECEPCSEELSAMKARCLEKLRAKREGR
ncbi:MAG: hypothetical protein AAF725_15545 [Acidobacteriota bacterium]